MNCYLCGKPLTAKNTHYEHIIPNGIAGKLQCDNILHKKCGENLGRDTDALFAKKFSLLLNILDAKFDRGNGTSAGCNINVDGIDFKCFIKNGHIYIVNLYIDEDNKIVYCNHKQLKNIRKKYGYSYSYTTEFGIRHIKTDSLLGLSSVDKKELVKIAVEFALYCGICIEDITAAFDFLEKKFKDTDIIPYYPINFFERFIEKVKWYFEKQRISINRNVVINSEYPSHSLHLFNKNKKLYCFISLFSFYEHYILLSDHYVGKDISEWHFESVVKSTPYESVYDLRNEDPKNIHICAMHWGTTPDDISCRIREAKNADPQNGGVLRNTFETEYKKKSPSSYMLEIVQTASQALLFQQCLPNNPYLISQHIPFEMKSCLDSIAGKKNDFFKICYDMQYLYYDRLEEEYFDLDRYKTTCLDEGEEITLPEEIQKNISSWQEEIDLFRRQQLDLVISASELIYPSSDL